MKDRHDQLCQYLKSRSEHCKIGIIIRSIDWLEPRRVVTGLAAEGNFIRAAAVGFDGIEPSSTEHYEIAVTIEKAVEWRSIPECSGSIIVFIKGDTDKLHSLAELETIYARDFAGFLVQQRIDRSTNVPVRNFWHALQDTVDRYPLDDVCTFMDDVDAASPAGDSAIPDCLWRLNLLKDNGILDKNADVKKRLRDNHELIYKISVLSETTRAALSRAIARIDHGGDQNRLQQAYRRLQDYNRSGASENLRELDMDSVVELLKTSKKERGSSCAAGTDVEAGGRTRPIGVKELGELINRAVVTGGEQEHEDLSELCDQLQKSYEDVEHGPEGGIRGPEGLTDGRTINLGKQDRELRTVVARYCTASVWGGIITSDHDMLREIIRDADETENCELFEPESARSAIAYAGGIDGGTPLFELFRRFDGELSQTQSASGTECFARIIEDLKRSRKHLLDRIDLLLYQPILLFSADSDALVQLQRYLEAWERLCRLFTDSTDLMRRISSDSMNFAAKALLLLDVLVLRSARGWKAMLMPLHPLYLWKYREIFTILQDRDSLSEENKIQLQEALGQLPQTLSQVFINGIATGDGSDTVLPGSGTLGMLPVYENSITRYQGNDGIEAVKETLERWLGYSPFTSSELRIAVVDAPNLPAIIRQINELMEERNCRRVVCHFYLTQGQNDSTPLSELDYAGRDHEISESIRRDRLAISVRELGNTGHVREEMKRHPVHVAFYFDQSSYKVDNGASNCSLYISPLVVHYDFQYDKINHTGTLSPSTETDAGLIGDYHKLLKTTGVITSGSYPRLHKANGILEDVTGVLSDGSTQWLAVADRDTDNSQPLQAIPICQRQYGNRRVSIWADSASRIMDEYLDILGKYALNPGSALPGMLCKFGHLISSDYISIPKAGTNAKVADSRKKGMLGELFSAVWYAQSHPNALVASLNNHEARVWLSGGVTTDERSDLIGLYHDEHSGVLHLDVIEVKAHDEQTVALIERSDHDSNEWVIRGHAADQIYSVIAKLRAIFSHDTAGYEDIFATSRREVLKYQIVSECFRVIHDHEWQYRWHESLTELFSSEAPAELEISGILLHINLAQNAGKDKQDRHCVYYSDDGDVCRIEYHELTAAAVQSQILDRVASGSDVTLPVESTSGTEHTARPAPTAQPLHPPAEPGTGGIPAAEPVLAASMTTETASAAGAVSSAHAPVSDAASAAWAFPPPASGGPAVREVNERTSATTGDCNQEIMSLAREFVRSCEGYGIGLEECYTEQTSIGPSVIRIPFRLMRGQPKSRLENRLDDIGREIRRAGLIIQEDRQSGELYLDVPRPEQERERVMFTDAICKLPAVTSPEQLFFTLGKTAYGADFVGRLHEMPHLLVGGSTGSGKSVFLFTLLASLILSHPRKEDMQLILSSSKPEDFIYFEGLPQLYNGSIIDNASDATQVIAQAVYEQFESRGRILTKNRVTNITEYNKKCSEKMPPIVVVIDEFADLSDQLTTSKERNAFYQPVQRIAQAGRSRGVHLVLCTQRPAANLVPSNIKQQLNGRIALRVNDRNSSMMILEAGGAQNLQKHGDMIYKCGNDVMERLQGYMLETSQLEQIIEDVKAGRPSPLYCPDHDQAPVTAALPGSDTA